MHSGKVGSLCLGAFMGDGWLKLYWKTKSSIAYSNGATFALWGHILLSVARKRTILRNGVVLESGDCVISATEVANWLGIHKTTVCKYLKAFEVDGMINIKRRDRNGTALSVCNWSTYQDFAGQSATKRDRNATESVPKRDRNCTQTEIPKKVKKEKKVKNKGLPPFDELFPTEMQLPEVSEAWAEYVGHREDIKKPLSSRGATMAAKKLAGWGTVGMVDSIRDSIAGGYQGVFEPKKNGSTQDDPRGNLALRQKLIDQGTF